MGGGGASTPDIIEMPNREDFVHQQTRAINRMQLADNNRAMDTGNFLKHDIWAETKDQFARGNRQGETVMQGLVGRSIRAGDTRSKDAVYKQFGRQEQIGNEILDNQEKIDRHNIKNAGALGAATVNSNVLNANAKAFGMASAGAKALNSQRFQLADIVNNSGNYDGNWMVGAALGGFSAYQGIQNEQQSQIQIQNAQALGQSMYADSFNGSGGY
jgi:hypothetical protein